MFKKQDQDQYPILSVRPSAAGDYDPHYTPDLVKRVLEHREHILSLAEAPDFLRWSTNQDGLQQTLHAMLLDVQAALCRIPPRQQQVVLHTLIMGVSEAETANLLGVHRTVVHKRVQRALARMAILLNDRDHRPHLLGKVVAISVYRGRRPADDEA